MGVLIIGLIIVLVGLAAYALIHPVRFVVTTVQWILTIAGIIMIFLSVTTGMSLGPAWASLFFIVTVLILFGANRMSVLKMRLVSPSR